MPSQQHTPGPWRLTDDNKARRVVKGGKPERSIVIVEDWTAEPDARLIAAAPEMLALIERLCDEAYKTDRTLAMGDALEAARALLAKVEGSNA